MGKELWDDGAGGCGYGSGSLIPDLWSLICVVRLSCGVFTVGDRSCATTVTMRNIRSNLFHYTKTNISRYVNSLYVQ